MKSIFDTAPTTQFNPATFQVILEILREETKQKAPKHMRDALEAAEEDVEQSRIERDTELTRYYSMGTEAYNRMESLYDSVANIYAEINERRTAMKDVNSEKENLEKELEELEAKKKALENDDRFNQHMEEVLPDNVAFNTPNNRNVLIKKISDTLNSFMKVTQLYHESLEDVRALNGELNTQLGRVTSDNEYFGDTDAKAGLKATVDKYRSTEHRYVSRRMEEAVTRLEELKKESPGFIQGNKDAVDTMLLLISEREQEIRALVDSNGSLQAYNEDTRREMCEEFLSKGPMEKIYNAYVHAAEVSATETTESLREKSFFRMFFDNLQSHGVNCQYGVETLKENHDDVYLLFRANNMPKLNPDGTPLTPGQLFELPAKALGKTKDQKTTKGGSTIRSFLSGIFS